MDIDQAKIDLSGDMAAPAQPAATNVSRSGIVDELAELRERVDRSIERLSTRQAARRRQSQGLMTRQITTIIATPATPLNQTTNPTVY